MDAGARHRLFLDRYADKKAPFLDGIDARFKER